jgi:hypothetical protein
MQSSLLDFMLGKNLKQVLTEAWSPRAPALFPTQVAIAKAIVALPGSRYEGRAQGLTAFINQIFNQGRSCPKELQQDIIAVALEAAKAAWKDDPSAPNARELEALLISLLPDTPGMASQVTEIFLRQVRAREVVIVNPLLENQGHPRLEDFEKVTVAGLRDTPPVRYLFLMDEKRGGEIVRHRDNLIAALGRENENGATADENSGQKLFDELWKADVLKIKTIPSTDCIPVVAFDANTNERAADIYFWDSAPQADGTTMDSIAKFGQRTRYRWLNSFYFHYIKREGAKDVDWDKISGDASSGTST